jgi:undecaprenyl-diphosphatase
MGTPTPRSFWQRRMARNERFGLGLSLGLLVCLILLASFGVIALEANGPQTPTVDYRIMRDLYEHRESSPNARVFFLGLTRTGEGYFIVAVAVTGTAILLLRRRWLAAALLVFAVEVGPIINQWVKSIFRRARPLEIDPSAPEHSFSFPSGHSMESMIAYGILAYVLVTALPHRRQRLIALLASALLILGIGFSRMYLSAHWFTDVLGGFSLGGAWLVLWITVMECSRRRAPIVRSDVE